MKKCSPGKKFLVGTLITLGVLATTYVGFGIWTEAKHNKSAYEYIHDKFKDDKEVVTSSEDGTVEASATINF